MKVLVIGAGKMVNSILAGLPADTVSSWGILSKSGDSAKNLAQKYGLTFVSSVQDFAHPDWILLGCKPQQLKEIKIPDVPVMSLLAAVTEKSQKNILAVKHLVRVMPNLPVKYKKGVTLLTTTSPEKVSYPQSLFGQLGLVKTLNEEEFEEITLLTGSGPALFYEFAKTLASSFQSLDEVTREELVKSVLSGAAASLKNDSLQKMIDDVTSKGGVTIAVLEEWRQSGFSQVLAKGVVSGIKRTEEIKSHLLQS